MKKISALLAILTCFLMLFATVQADDLTDVLNSGTLRLGVPPEYIPFIIEFPDNDEVLAGIDIELMEEIADRMGVSLQTINLSFDGMIDALNLGQVDIIGGAFSKTDERATLVDFTKVYYTGDAQFIGSNKLQLPEEFSPESFRNLKIGVQKGTSFDQWIKTNLVSAGFLSAKNVFSYNSVADEVKALDRGDVDLILLDQDAYEAGYRDTGKYKIFYHNLAEENYAFGLRKNSSLTQVINEHLSDMLKDGTAQQIADKYFHMYLDSADADPSRSSIILPPVQTNQPARTCVNGMQFVSDVSIKDGHQVNPGEKFQKIWRVRNNGTCTWTPGYSFSFVSGDQMSGRTVRISSAVKPGETIDLAVDLIAPNAKGTYKGNWQMRTPQGVGFGQVVWVKVRVNSSISAVPSPDDGQKYRPVDITEFVPEYYSGMEGECVNIFWAVNGADMIEITADGRSLYRGEDPDAYNEFCAPLTEAGTHTVQLYAFNTTADAYSTFEYKTVTDDAEIRNRNDGQSDDPTIDYFTADSKKGYIGDCVTVNWSVINASEIWLSVDDELVQDDLDEAGELTICEEILQPGIYSIVLNTQNDTGSTAESILYETLDDELEDEVVSPISPIDNDGWNDTESSVWEQDSNISDNDWDSEDDEDDFDSDDGIENTEWVSDWDNDADDDDFDSYEASGWDDDYEICDEDDYECLLRNGLIE
ncbi:MAG: transporter substrate-binding domain-containing protein [Anaerolineaceae bacterium]|nr:transporter substrate-binding domain-containing protein [Anaerolineaceae bacterium]